MYYRNTGHCSCLNALLYSFTTAHLVVVGVFNTTLNNISVISWQSGLFVEETGVPGENHQPATSQ